MLCPSLAVRGGGSVLRCAPPDGSGPFVAFRLEGPAPPFRGRQGFHPCPADSGLLVGGIVYLQLTALIVLALRDPRVMPLMVAGAVLLVLLRLFKKVFPEVSAS